MSYNIPEDERPQANKKAQEGLNILASDVDNTLNRVRNLQSETLVDAYNRPVDEPMARTLSPLEQYAYEPQPVPELGSITEPMARESMVVPQEQPKVLSNFVNQYEAVPQRDMVSVTPYEQAVVDLRDSEVNSLRNDAGEISSSSLEVFSKPLDANKIKILGLADENMKPTKKGELFYNLTNMGMFNEDGTITEKGLAYMTPLKEMAAPEWITQPGNMEKFDLLWQDGVIRSSSTPTEILGAVTKFAGDVVYGAGELAQQQALGLAYNSRTWGGLLGLEDNRPAALKAQSEVSELSVMENVYKNVVGLITMVDVGLATDKKLFEDYVASPIGAAYEKITGDEFPELRATDRSNPNVKDSEDALVAARHKQWAANQRLADMEAGEIAETFLGIENSVKQAESLKKKIGNDEFKKIYGGVGAFSSVVLDPTNAVPAAFAVKAARSAPLASRAMLNAQNTMGKVAAMELAIAQGDVAVQAARAKLAKVEPTVGLAKRMAESFAERAKVQPNLVEKSQTAANIARRISDEADQIRSALPTITQELEGLVAKRNSLATRIPEAYSQKILQTMEIGRQARSLPAKALGATLEGVGDTISKADTAITNFLQERGLDQIYTAAVGAAGVVGMAGSPVIGTVAAGAAALKSGKVLSSYGKLFRYVGKEMENVRGQIPFWKRVAAHTAPGSLGRGIAHTFNTFDLGGVTSDTLRRTARGVAAALPTDFMFEYLSDGADMRPETLYQAGAESLVIGGSFAAAGGAFMGTKKRMRELSIGDELNFRQNMTDPRQRALFQVIPSSTRRAISTYAIANPTLKYVFKDSGASKYDPNTNTASINVNSTNPIKALVAHETLHHTIIKNNMEAGIAALFLGDTKTNSAGGLFRSRDGTFDPNFEAFKNAYYKRLGAEGMTNAERNAIYPIDKIAVEYFIEKHSDQYASMAESGALGAVASSGAARRKLGSILETVLPRVPVLKDLHFKSGGMIDANGSWVTGNGILDVGGVRRDPITSKMFREMNRRSSGLSPGQFDPLMSDKPDSGAPILLDPSSGIDTELLHPLINVDANGKPILQNGKPVALDRATELSRALGGLTAIEVMQRKRADNYAPEKGEAHIDSEGEFQPGWLSNDVITEMFAKNNYNSEQKRIIKEMNRLIKKGTGERVVMINFAATGRNRAGKVVYKPQEATLRDTVPVAVTISEAGNVLFGLMSVTKLNENIQKRAQSKRGKKLYGGNVDLILQDTQAMMAFHKNGTDSIEYFKKYGAVEADERKKFINTMFGLLNKKEQAVLNPMLLEDDVKSRDNVYRTYRADRVSKAVPMSPEEYPAMPFSYESVSQVRMPEQARQMPEGKYDRDTAIRNKQVFADRFENFGPQVGVNGFIYGWQRPSDGKFIGLDQHHFLYRDGDGNQLGDPSSIGYVRIVKEGNTLFYDGKPNSKQLRELKDSAIESGLELQNATPRDIRYMPESIDADYMKAVDSGDVEAQQRMVDAAAKAAGFNVGPLYHGSENFKGTKLENPNKQFTANHSFWFTDDIELAEYYAGYPDEPRTLLSEDQDGPAILQFYIKDPDLELDRRNYEGEEFKEKSPVMDANLQLSLGRNQVVKITNIDDKIDSEVVGDSTVYGVRDADLARSADPILRDSSGNVIPLSQRFNEKSSDIRHMPEPVKKEKKKKERQIIGEDRVIDKGDEDTLDVIQAIGAKTKEPSWKDDKPVPVSFGYDLTTAPHIDKFAGNVEDPSTAFLDDIPYDLNGAEKERVEKLIKNGVVDYLANDMVERTRIALENPAIAAGRGWYSRMRVKLLNAFGDVGREIFSQFLGATSAQTPDDENFQQAVDANEGMNSGRYDRHREGYLKAIKAESEGTLDTEITKTRSVENIKGIIGDLKEKLPSVTTKADRIAIYAELKSLEELIDIPVDERTVAQRIKIYVVGNDLLPRRSNGAKFNANSGAVLKVIAGVWLNNRKSPKTPNFAGNLSGRTVQATIDIWAARFLRRQIYGGQGVPWRIQPKSEVGVSNEDFAFAQVVMARAAKKLGMNPDDLQAILWFAEKDVWDKKGWTKNEGAKKSSFDDIFDIFFPEGKKPLSFAEGSALIKATKDREKAIAKEEEKAKIKAEAKALGMSIAALNRMKKTEK